MKRVADAWERFWFAPQPTSSLALFRIAIGIISFGWALSLVPDFHAFFSSEGVEPIAPVHPPAGVWGVLNTFPDYPVAVGLLLALLVASLCLTVGYRTRLASVVVFVAMLSFEHRAPSIWNSGDGLLLILCFFLMFAPAGASLSVDRWRTDTRPVLGVPGARAVGTAARSDPDQRRVPQRGVVQAPRLRLAGGHGRLLRRSDGRPPALRTPRRPRALVGLQHGHDLLDDRDRAHGRDPRVESSRAPVRARTRRRIAPVGRASTCASGSSARRCSPRTLHSSRRLPRSPPSSSSGTGCTQPRPRARSAADARASPASQT